jgi:SulP family sulfate permease
MTAVSMVVIAGIVQVYEGDITNALPAIFAVFMMVGLMQVFLGVLKLGKYIKYIPYPVVSEFMTGIGVIILITQLLTAIGYYPTEDTQFVKKFRPVAKEVILKSILENEIDDQLLVLKNFEVTIEKARNVTTEQLLTESKTLAKKDSSGVLGALRTVPVAIQNINGLELGLNIIIILLHLVLSVLQPPFLQL